MYFPSIAGSAGGHAVWCSGAALCPRRNGERAAHAAATAALLTARTPQAAGPRGRLGRDQEETGKLSAVPVIVQLFFSLNYYPPFKICRLLALSWKFAAELGVEALHVMKVNLKSQGQSTPCGIGLDVEVASKTGVSFTAQKRCPTFLSHVCDVPYLPCVLWFWYLSFLISTYRGAYVAVVKYASHFR